MCLCVYACVCCQGFKSSTLFECMNTKGCLLFQARSQSFDRLSRGKMSIAVNLKRKEGVSVIKRLCNNADVLIEPFRVGEFTTLYHRLFLVVTCILWCVDIVFLFEE